MTIQELMQSDAGRDIIMESIPTTVMDLARNVSEKIRSEAITTTDNALHFMREGDLVSEDYISREIYEAVHNKVVEAVLEIFLEWIAQDFGFNLDLREM